LTGGLNNNFTLGGLNLAFVLKYQNNQFFAEGTSGISLGSYNFSNARFKISSSGTPTLEGTLTQPFNIGGLLSNFTLKYQNNALFAEGASSISLGAYSFSSAKFKISSSGAVSLEGGITNNFIISGINTAFTLKYENNELFAESALGISLGNYNFPQARFKISSSGAVSLLGNLTNAFSIAGLNPIQFNLKYENGILYAIAASGINLGNYGFDAARIKIASHGDIVLTGGLNNNFTLGGLNLAFVLKYQNNQFFAEGTSGISLGSYNFPEAKFRISSVGLVSLVGNLVNNFSLPGISSLLPFTLTYNNGVIRATGSRVVSLGNYSFNASFSIDSNGNVTVSGSNTFNISGRSIGFNLHYANGVFSAVGNTNIAVAGVNFSNATVTISSNGTLDASGTASYTYAYACPTWENPLQTCNNTVTATLHYSSLQGFYFTY
ncbi:MAG: hypothetical protein NC936_05325, partial [Candidatus Omnitrophica bacterium]|nr:hypothetical protein [Candidatus Omnitrophota bacterium]